MQFSPYVHEQVVRDRREALLRAAAAHRLVAREPREPLALRLRCRAARFGLRLASPGECTGRKAVSTAAR
jgi:hypothetical protein